ICLIQKKEDVVHAKDFRPISFTTLTYKVAKVLADRLKLVIYSIISPFQSAFFEGRQILDSILIANEAVEGYRAKKKRGWILKL
ncbi:reverse transcriptase domain-containing protein, partial [Klebsiella pneumoniae]